MAAPDAYTHESYFLMTCEMGRTEGFETVTVDDLLVSTSGASLRLLILDACRNNPLARSMQRTGAISSGSSGSSGSSADLNEDLLGDETLVAPPVESGEPEERNYSNARWS